MDKSMDSHASLQAFQNAFLAAPTGRMLVQVMPEQRFKIIEVNTAAAQYFLLSREDMINKDPRDFLESAVAEQIEQSLMSCLRLKRTVTTNMLPRIAGGVKMQTFILTPVPGASGDITHIDILARPDTVDGQQLQRERDDAILLLTSLFDASGMGIIVTDHHGRIVRVNDSFLTQTEWTREDLLGEEFFILIPPEEHDVMKKLHDSFIERGRHGSRELQILRKDGTLTDVVITTALLELSQKRRFMVSTVSDVTERKNMMRNLRRAKEDADGANKAKSTFLANMSHELRTPLNAIIGFSEMMKNQTFGPVNNLKYEEYLSDIHFSARHLLDIINDVLDMAKIEAGKIDLMEASVSVSDVLQSVMRIMADRAAVAMVRLDMRTEPNLPPLIADQRLVRQMLINLVANAVKFSPPDKSVRIEAKITPAKTLMISVIDEGSGIPADKLRVVLEPFGQAHDPRKHSGQGTGLGLPLAKAMIELHGGQLHLESQEGYGTKVDLEFPSERLLTTTAK
jgi:PAS domain S-box-containing protein